MYIFVILSALQLNFHSDWIISSSLRSRRLEVVGERENGRVWGRHARVACLLLAPIFSCAHYMFQAPALQATSQGF